ncbi:hypothetical protein KIN20_014386 [Parelaphostrongylus tenuis]|uniref:Uncharacterized protein n=1 Tax=Parelaphostrongylus tenuis TaxID=148309 RepID=A0AAD5MX99_PARTN|nr:hypothetical protein KIN20_014386 [Parelaphostrongylus tenuis]
MTPQLVKQNSSTSLKSTSLHQPTKLQVDYPESSAGKQSSSRASPMNTVFTPNTSTTGTPDRSLSFKEHNSDIISRQKTISRLNEKINALITIQSLTDDSDRENKDVQSTVHTAREYIPSETSKASRWS